MRVLFHLAIVVPVTVIAFASLIFVLAIGVMKDIFPKRRSAISH